MNKLFSLLLITAFAACHCYGAESDNLKDNQIAFSIGQNAATEAHIGDLTFLLSEKKIIGEDMKKYCGNQICTKVLSVSNFYLLMGGDPSRYQKLGYVKTDEYDYFYKKLHEIQIWQFCESKELVETVKKKVSELANKN